MSSMCAGDTVAGCYLVERPLELDPIFESYAATDQREGQEVLLLTVNPEVLSSASDHQLFLRRAERALSLSVPGMARVHRVTSDRGRAVIVGEPVSGPSLRVLIDSRRHGSDLVAPGGAISLLRAVAAILQAAAPDCAHAYLIPSNVFVEERGVRLIAFGLATALPVERSTAAFAAEPAVRRYLAPEVLGGRLGEPGSDVYSLAVIAGDLLGARRPRELLGRVLASSLDERPSSALAFVDELEAAVRTADALDEPTRAEREPATRRRARAITLKEDLITAAPAAGSAMIDGQPVLQAPPVFEAAAVSAPASTEAPAPGERDAAYDLDPRLVQAALILDSVRSEAAGDCADRAATPQPSPLAADADEKLSRPSGATATDWPIFQAPIITVSSPEPAPPARPQVPDGAKKTWVRDTVKLSAAEVPSWVQSMEEAAARAEAAAAPAGEVEAPPSPEPVPAPGRQPDLPVVAPGTELVRAPDRQQPAKMHPLVKWAPAAAASKPIIKPTDDRMSWGLLLALVGGLLLVVYLVAFVAVSLME